MNQTRQQYFRGSVEALWGNCGLAIDLLLGLSYLTQVIRLPRLSSIQPGSIKPPAICPLAWAMINVHTDPEIAYHPQGQRKSKEAMFAFRRMTSGKRTLWPLWPSLALPLSHSQFCAWCYRDALAIPLAETQISGTHDVCRLPVARDYVRIITLCVIQSHIHERQNTLSCSYLKVLSEYQKRIICSFDIIHRVPKSHCHFCRGYRILFPSRNHSAYVEVCIV